MEFLDDYKFKFAEAMNKYKNLTAILDRIQDPEIERQIESAVCDVLSRNKVNLVNLKETAEEKYPKLCALYANFDGNYMSYNGSMKINKVERFVRTIKDVVEKYNKESGMDVSKINDPMYHLERNYVLRGLYNRILDSLKTINHLPVFEYYMYQIYEAYRDDVYNKSQ